MCEIDEIIGGKSQLLSRLIGAAREGHLCIKGGEEDCDVKLLEGEEPWFEERAGRWNNLYYLQRNWVIENEVVREFKRLLQEDVRPIKIEKIGGVNEEQCMAVKIGLSKGVVCLAGGAGTGKSYTIQKIVEHFTGKVCVCAPTGKAAALLQEKLDMEVRTLHKTLGVKNGKDLLFGRGEIHCDMVIVDECSMIDACMWARLLRGVKRGTRLILVGDYNQLPPIEVGAVFKELCDYMKEYKQGYVYLNQSMRSDRREVLVLAEKIRRGEMVAYQRLEKGIEKFWERGYQLLSCVKRGPYGVEMMNRLCEGGDEQPIIITRTNHRMGINNGEVGIIRGGEIIIGNRSFREALIPEYEKGYCLSVHKSQGSEFEKVALLVPKGSERFGREILYTGITRAKDKVVVFSEQEVMESCIQCSSKKMSGIRMKLRATKVSNDC